MLSSQTQIPDYAYDNLILILNKTPVLTHTLSDTDSPLNITFVNFRHTQTYSMNHQKDSHFLFLSNAPK